MPGFEGWPQYLEPFLCKKEGEDAEAAFEKAPNNLFSFRNKKAALTMLQRTLQGSVRLQRLLVESVYLIDTKRHDDGPVQMIRKPWIRGELVARSFEKNEI